MTHKLTLEKFQGPLDLLLQLIEQEKLSITEVALSKVTEQYFAYLAGLGEGRSEELADFLVTATKLVYLKSRHLLPYLYPPEEDDGPSLADQLKLYKQYLEAAKYVNILWQARRVAYGREEPPLKISGFVLPGNARIYDLRQAMFELLKRIKPLVPLPRLTMDRSVSVKQKIEFLFGLLQRLKQVSFNDILSKAANRTEAVVSFLAVLELIKQGKVSFHQDRAFEEMLIKRV